MARLLGERAIFPVFPASYTPDGDTLLLTTANGLRIVARHLDQSGAAWTILYSHGNGEDMGAIHPVLQEFADHGFAVFAYEYPGYGHSQGPATETNACRAAEAALNHLTQVIGVPVSRVILYGRSVGSGPSLFLARRHRVAGVILEGAFVSAYRVVTRLPLFPGDRFPNLKRIQSLRVPLLVIHGALDRTVPFWHGLRLYRTAPGPKQCLWISEAGHNNIRELAGEKYWKSMQDFTEMLESEVK